MKLSEELMYRGFVAQNTLDKITDLDGKKRSFYWGTDPSADSLHTGHLAALMMLKIFIKNGYKPYLLVGGATGMIGDPKASSERDTKTIEEIRQNSLGLSKQIQHIMGRKVPLVNNYDWFKDINVLDFLREVGKQFSMTQLLDREFVKARIGKDGSGISLAEFCYSTIQGYDFLHLYRAYGIDLQLCGADQFGNCVSGMQLIRKLENARADVWSCPLILDADGVKFGKSEGNAIWLDPKRTSPFEYYQFWLNTSDEKVGELIKIYTEIEPAEINEIMALHAKNPGARSAQKALALAATEILHGRETAVNVTHISNVLFGDEDVRELSKDGLKLLAETIPVAKKGITAVEALVATDNAASNSEAIRLIKGNAISVNGEKITADAKISELSLIKKGKNSFVLVK